MEIKSEWGYCSLRPSLRTGDFFFTRARGLKGHFFSCHGPVSHMGFIIRYGNRVFGFDATKQGGRNGSTLFNLSDLLFPLPAKFFIIHNNFDKEAQSELKQLSYRFCHQPYENKPWRLGAFYFGRKPKSNLDSLFCSELVVLCLNSIFGTRFTPHHYHPNHLFPNSKSDIRKHFETHGVFEE